MNKNKVYVEEITTYDDKNNFVSKHTGKVYKSIKSFEKNKDKGWNGNCEWELHLNQIKTVNDFLSYKMTLKQIGKYHEGEITYNRFYVSVKGKEVI